MELTLRLCCLPEPVLRRGVTAETRTPLGLFCAHIICVLGLHTALILYPQAITLLPLSEIRTSHDLYQFLLAIEKHAAEALTHDL